MVEIAKKRFYVDDCLIRVANENKGTRLVKNLQNLLVCGEFRLTKWISNSTTVIHSIEVEDRTQVMPKIELGAVVSERVLVMRWNVQSYDFQFVINLSSRNLSSITNAVFDSFEFFNHVVLEARLLFIKLCHDKTKWDEPVSPTDAVHLGGWKESLCNLKDFVVPRCVKPMRDVSDVGVSYTHLQMPQTWRVVLCVICDMWIMMFKCPVHW